MSDNGVKIGASNEILGAMLSADANLSELKANVREYIFDHYDVDLGNIELVVAENDASTVHLALPYYAGLEKLSADAIADDDTHDVVGAEIVIAVTVAITVGSLGVALLGAASAGASAAANSDRK